MWNATVKEPQSSPEVRHWDAPALSAPSTNICVDVQLLCPAAYSVTILKTKTLQWRAWAFICGSKDCIPVRFLGTALQSSTLQKAILFSLQAAKEEEAAFTKNGKEKQKKQSRSCWPGPLGTYCWSQHGSDTVGCVYSMGCTHKQSWEQGIFSYVKGIDNSACWDVNGGTGLLWKFCWVFCAF